MDSENRVKLVKLHHLSTKQIIMAPYAIDHVYKMSKSAINSTGRDCPVVLNIDCACAPAPR